MTEVDEGARSEDALRDERGARSAVPPDIRTGADRDHAGEDPGNWPYLAI